MQDLAPATSTGPIDGMPTTSPSGLPGISYGAPISTPSVSCRVDLPNGLSSAYPTDTTTLTKKLAAIISKSWYTPVVCNRAVCLYVSSFFSRLREIMCRYFFLPSLLIAVPFAQAQTLIIPQMADGANWQTTLVLTNTTASATSASVNFFQDIGGGATQSWTPPFVEVNSTQNLALPAGGTLFLHTPGTASALTVGWGQLQPNPAVVAYAIYTLRVPGRQDQDVTSAAAPGATRYLVPFDNTKGFVTSIAIANPTNAAESISVGIETSSGASSLPSPISLPGLGHTTFVLPTKFAATMGQTGLIEFSSASGTFSVLALRTNPTGAFATAPVYPETGPPIITGSTTQPINSITVNSAALGITNLLLVFPTANGGFSSGSVQGLLKANGSPNGSYSATWNNVTVNGQTLTFTGLQTSASTMQNTGGTTANISSATLTLTLTPQGPTGG